ncbi:MAG: PDZ domain-containing protein [Elusimicrobiota bacterium]|nr:PDZ domain-containing protein [Elusimicrobiota bacterium]
MYPRKKTKYATDPETEQVTGAEAPEECFAEQAAKWIYILAFVVMLLMAVGINRFFQQVRRLPPGQRGIMNAVAWTTAYNAGGATAMALTLQIPELGLEAASAPDGQGVAVVAIYAGGRAEAAGLMETDQIVTFNGRKVGTPIHFQGLVSRALPETDIVVEILRGGVIQTTTITIPETDPKSPIQVKPAALTL